MYGDNDNENLKEAGESKKKQHEDKVGNILLLQPQQEQDISQIQQQQQPQKQRRNSAMSSSSSSSSSSSNSSRSRSSSRRHSNSSSIYDANIDADPVMILTDSSKLDSFDAKKTIKKNPKKIITINNSTSTSTSTTASLLLSSSSSDEKDEDDNQNECQLEIQDIDKLDLNNVHEKIINGIDDVKRIKQNSLSARSQSLSLGVGVPSASTTKTLTTNKVEKERLTATATAYHINVTDKSSNEKYGIKDEDAIATDSEERKHQDILSRKRKRENIGVAIDNNIKQEDEREREQIDKNCSSKKFASSSILGAKVEDQRHQQQGVGTKPEKLHDDNRYGSSSFDESSLLCRPLQDNHANTVASLAISSVRTSSINKNSNNINSHRSRLKKNQGPSLFVPVRQYYHSGCYQKMHDEDFDVDSDNELDETWQFYVEAALLEEFTDVTRREKIFMKMWNQFMPTATVVGSDSLPIYCVKFIRKYAKVIKNSKLHEQLLWHLTNLWDESMIAPIHLYQCMQEYKFMVDKMEEKARLQEEKQQSEEHTQNNN